MKITNYNNQNIIKTLESINAYTLIYFFPKDKSEYSFCDNFDFLFYSATLILSQDQTFELDIPNSLLDIEDRLVLQN